MLVASGALASLRSRPRRRCLSLALDTYPSAAREPLATAHREAAARPFDADAVCGLARLLHAWEQWEGAHQAYTRCQLLAPRVFDWFYLDALVLQRLARHDAAAGRSDRHWPWPPAISRPACGSPSRCSEAGEPRESRDLFEALAREQAAAPAAELGLGRIDCRRRPARTTPSCTCKRAIRIVSRVRQRLLRARALVPRTGRTEEARGARCRPCAVRAALAGSRRSGARSADLDSRRCRGESATRDQACRGGRPGWRDRGARSGACP